MMNGEDQPTLSPEDFGRRAAEAMMPVITDSLRQTLSEFSDDFLKSLQSVQQAKPATPEWKGGAPSTEQVRSMLSGSGTSGDDKIIAVLEEIKGILLSLPASGGGT